MNDLYRQSFLPDLLIAALDRHGDRPAVHIGGDVLTATGREEGLEGRNGVYDIRVENQKGELVCDGEHKYLVKKRPQ